MNSISILYQRQYNFNTGLSKNSCLPFKSSFIPPSSFNNLNAVTNYEFEVDTYSPITVITKNDEKICLANDMGTVVLLDKKSMVEDIKFDAHDAAIFDIKWRPNYDEFILTASGDRNIALWDINRIYTGGPMMIFHSAHFGSVKTLTFQSPNVFISGGRDGAIKFFDIRCPCTCARSGPALVIPNPHVYSLPKIKSHFKTAKARRNNPIAASSAFNYHPSNVVTCVLSNPNNENYFYSSGISDNAVKVWDIRRLNEFDCSIAQNPIKIHTTKNLKSNVNHGFSSLIINNSSYGEILYASSTNGNIYAFVKNSIYPAIVFSGRYSNYSTKITSFGEDYLLSGSSNGRIYLWNCNFKPSLENKEENIISIENRLPIYSFDFNLDEEVPLVLGDFDSLDIYTASNPSILWKWTFKSNSDSNNNNNNSMPKCTEFVPPENYESTYNISLKRVSPFETMTYISKSSLTSIRDWVKSDSKRFKSDNNANIINATPMVNDENRLVSKSTSYKSTKKLQRNVKKSRRSLFETNRKIKEFFSSSH